MELPALVPGRFLTRENRFRVQVEVEGRPTPAHLPNSGRLLELLHPGRRVYLMPRPGKHRKTPYDLVLVDLDGLLVSVDARLPTDLFLEAWRAGRLPWLPYGPGWQVVREPACGHGRLDALLEGPRGARVWVETKSVTWVQDGVAYFPDAPTARGRRHLRCLAEKVRAGDRGVVVFIVQRPDARVFSPHPAGPHFPQALREAHAQGVEVYAHRFRVTHQTIEPVGPIPVRLDLPPDLAAREKSTPLPNATSRDAS